MRQCLWGCVTRFDAANAAGIDAGIKTADQHRDLLGHPVRHHVLTQHVAGYLDVAKLASEHITDRSDCIRI